jgi:outer membrane biosynthesis protein TonB
MNRLIRALLFPAMLCAQSTIEMESPNRSVVRPGETVILNVRTGKTYERIWLVGGKFASSQELTVPPYRFSVQIPSNTVPGPYPFHAMGCEPSKGCEEVGTLEAKVDRIWPASADGSREVHDASGVTVDMQGNPLMHRPPIAYPKDAIEAGVWGTAIVELTPTWEGKVGGVQYLSGPEELRKHVIKAVLLWHFPVQAGTLPRQVKITFDPGEARRAEGLAVADEVGPLGVSLSNLDFWDKPIETPAPVLKSIRVIAVSEDVRQELLKRIQVSIGQPMEHEDLARVARQTGIFDNDLRSWFLREGGEASITIAPLGFGLEPTWEPPETAPRPATVTTPGRIKVSASEQNAKLISKVDPVYSETARLNHYQGVVRLRVLVGTDGRVLWMVTLQGQTHLSLAAQDAVQKWVYSPTLLKGTPVEVVTEVEVEFFPPN